MTMRATSPEKSVHLKANMVVLGGGAGIAAAVAAAENGATDIIVLERQGHYGGHSMFPQGLFACESPVQKREHIITDRDECFKTIMKWAHWGRIEPRVIRAYLNKSGDTIRWFQEKGVDFEIKTWYPSQKVRGFHWPLKPNGEYALGADLIKILLKESERQGVKLLLHTRAQNIIRGLKGNITGVTAVNDDGQEIHIKTGSVIIATGSFAGNIELLKKYCPDYYDGMFIDEGSSHHSGDGLLMAEKIGAAIADYVPIEHSGPHPDYSKNKGSLAASMKEPIAGIVREPYTVWVNKMGKRFVDETAGYILPEAGNAILRQPEKLMYTLFDDRIRQNAEEKGFVIGRGWGKQESEQRVKVPGLGAVLRKRAGEGKESLVKIDDSWGGIARNIGADSAVLAQEIDEYNSFCQQGYDEIFAKERRYLVPLDKPPFYAIRCVAPLGQTMGGIKVNERMEVLDKDYHVIPGLYAMGDIADGWSAQTYCGECCGTSFGFAINSGRIAGESAAKYVLRKE